MSDHTQGEGWWQASDGQWYPPEQHPDFQAGATQPVESVPPPTAAMPVAPPPGGPPPAAPVGPGGPGAGSSNAKWIIVGVLAVAAVALAAFLLLGGDDDKKQNVAASSSSEPSSSSSSSSSSRSSSSSSKSSSSSSSGPTAADLQRRLLKASDLSPDFTDVTFKPDNTNPTPCGQPNTNKQFPPVIDVGSTARNSASTAFFQEEVSTYKDEATAAKAFDAGKQGVSCGQGTLSDGSAVTLSAPKDVSSEVNAPGAVEIDFQAAEFSGQVIAVPVDNAIVTFQFQAASGVDVSTLPDAVAVAKKGMEKLLA